jgi:hypothetical protein
MVTFNYTEEFRRQAKRLASVAASRHQSCCEASLQNN